jgi:hypothetical protein
MGNLTLFIEILNLFQSAPQFRLHHTQEYCKVHLLLIGGCIVQLLYGMTFPQERL